MASSWDRLAVTCKEAAIARSSAGALSSLYLRFPANSPGHGRIRSWIGAALSVAAAIAACGSETRGVTAPARSEPPSAAAKSTTANVNGIGSAIPAFYDAKLFKIQFTELPPGGETANLTSNGSINNIYQSDGCMPGGKPFVSVIDAIPTDGMNPLWQEVQVVFTKPGSCQQFTSDDQVLAAAAAGIVSLQPTGELYRCPVIGKP